MTKTVVAVDGSDYGDGCADSGRIGPTVSFPRPGSRACRLAQARPDRHPRLSGAPGPAGDMACLSGAAGDRAGCSGQVRCQVLFGHPVEEILRFARQEETDLLILGSLGASGIKELLLGSVATQVVTHAPCSVMVVRPGFRFNDG